MTQQKVLEGLLDECHVDHVGLWELVSRAHFDLNAEHPDDTRQVALALVHALLNKPEILVGHPAPDGKSFVPWNLTPEEAFRRIEREWLKLGREPTIGEIAWFTSAD